MVDAAKVISAKLSEQEQDVELESLKSSNETIVAAVGNNDEDDDETGNVSMVETVVVHVARSGARQAQSSVDDVECKRSKRLLRAGRKKRQRRLVNLGERRRKYTKEVHRSLRQQRPR